MSIILLAACRTVTGKNAGDCDVSSRMCGGGAIVACVTCVTRCRCRLRAGTGLRAFNKGSLEKNKSIVSILLSWLLFHSEKMAHSVIHIVGGEEQSRTEEILTISPFACRGYRTEARVSQNPILRMNSDTEHIPKSLDVPLHTRR